MSKKEAVQKAVATKIKFKTLRRVTLPIIKLVPDVPRYLEVTDAIFQGKEIAGQTADKDGKKRAPAMLVNVVDLETGEAGQIVMNKVLMSTLQEEYPEDTYVGRQFQIVKLAKKEGKDYHPFSVTEIEIDKPAKTEG